MNDVAINWTFLTVSFSKINPLQCVAKNTDTEFVMLGLLQKGDGALYTAANFPMNLTDYVGTGAKRRTMLSGSSSGSGPLDASLMRVVSMTSGPDGSVYVGDFNLVRKVSSQGDSVETILQLQ